MNINKQEIRRGRGGLCANLVKVDIVIKGHEMAELGGPKPSDGVSTHRQKDKSHVELQSLRSALGCEETISHNLKSILLFILVKLPRK